MYKLLSLAWHNLREMLLHWKASIHQDIERQSEIPCTQVTTIY